MSHVARCVVSQKFYFGMIEQLSAQIVRYVDQISLVGYVYIFFINITVLKLFQQKCFLIKSKMASLVEFLEDIGERAEDEEARRDIEEGLENLGHHRSIRNRSNPLEDLTERQTR